MKDKYKARIRRWWAAGGLSVSGGLALMWLVIPGLFLGLMHGWGRLAWALVVGGVLLTWAFELSNPSHEARSGSVLGPAVEQIPD